MEPRIVAPAVTGTVIVPGAGWVASVVIISKALTIVSTIMFVSMLAVVMLANCRRLDV